MDSLSTANISRNVGTVPGAAGTFKLVRQVLTAILVTAAGTAAADPLFSYNGKDYRAEDLPAGQRQTLYELETEHHDRLRILMGEVILEDHLRAEGKKAGLRPEAMEEKLLSVKAPTDKEVSDWYEGNKHRLPPGYKLEQIAGDIKTLLQNEARKKQRDTLIESLKVKGNAVLKVAEPSAPVFSIAIGDRPRLGRDTAPVTIVEFADYQCPHCKAAGEALKSLLKKYGDKVSLVYFDFPINQSGISLKVAHGAYCAGKEGKYWEYHDLAFERQQGLSAESPLELARELKLDEARFKACAEGEEARKFVEASRLEGERIGISGTPSIFINGRRIRGYEETELTEAVDKALALAAGKGDGKARR